MVKAVRHLSIAQTEQFARRELSPTEMQRLEAHLESCPQCLDRVEAEASSILGLRMMDVG
jgi:anti-sigma factor RsiW